MITLHFVGATGASITIEAQLGDSVMQVATSAGVPGISADCGGSLSCGTCHAYVADEFVARLPPAGDDELAMLENLIDPRPCSRLTCQLTVSADMDGIRFVVPADAF